MQKRTSLTKVLKLDQEDHMVSITRVFTLGKGAMLISRSSEKTHTMPTARTTCPYTAAAYSKHLCWDWENRLCSWDTISPPLSYLQSKNRRPSLWPPLTLRNNLTIDTLNELPCKNSSESTDSSLKVIRCASLSGSHPGYNTHFISSPQTRASSLQKGHPSFLDTTACGR